MEILDCQDRDCFTLSGFAMTAVYVTARSKATKQSLYTERLLHSYGVRNDANAPKDGSAPCVAKAGLSRRERVHKSDRMSGFMLSGQTLHPFRIRNDVNSPTDRGCAVRSEGGFTPPRACT